MGGVAAALAAVAGAFAALNCCNLGYNPEQSTAAEFQALIEADIDRFAELAERMGMRVD